MQQFFGHAGLIELRAEIVIDVFEALPMTGAVVEGGCIDRRGEVPD